MGKTRSRIGVGVRFLLIYWSRRLVSNYKIETKNDTRAKCDFDVTIGFPNFKISEYDIRKIFGVGLESELNLSGVEVESEIRDSSHLCCPSPK